MPSQTRQMNRAQQTTPQTPEGGDLSRMGPMGESLLSALLYGNSFMQASLARGGGSEAPLDPRMRETAEDSLGVPLGDVRVHEGPEAQQRNQQDGSLAQAEGQDIYLGEQVGNNKNPVLAHEVAHTVQKQGGVQCKDGPGPRGGVEAEADQAASDMLAGRPAQVSGDPSTEVRHFDSFEHAELGDGAAGAGRYRIQGVEVSSGEINALGDFYATPQDLLCADPTELQQLVTLIRRQRRDPSSVDDKDWEAATHGRYTELATNNDAHFGPQNAALLAPQGASTGQDNRGVWRGYHMQALRLGEQVALNPCDPCAAENLGRARVINNFGDHYLSDAFSAGHLFNKPDMMKIVQDKITALDKTHAAALFSGIATSVFSAKRAYISKYEVDAPGPWWPNLDSASMFQRLLEGIYEERPDVVYNALVKAAHDQLNHQTGGVAVENDFGSWHLSGDDTLASSPDTQKWCQRAIEQSRQNLDDVACTGSSYDLDGLVDKVLAFLPRPTAASTTAIHDMLTQMCDPAGTMSASLSGVITAEIETMFEKLVEMGKVRLA